MSPDEVRQLRGDMTRAEFASMVGVTPLTIYRWELDESEQESRRPQKRLRERLSSLARGDAPITVSPTRNHRPRAAADLTATERVTLNPIFDAIMSGQWGRAENALMSAFSMERLSSTAAQILAQTANGLLKLLWRNDVRGAYSGFGQTLRDLEELELSAEVAVPAHALAALLFASPDGRIFNPGRVNSHVAQAEHYLVDGSQPDFHTILRVAEMWAAYHLDDAGLHDRLRLRNKDVFKLATTPVARWMAWEVGTIAAYLGGCVVEGARFLEQLVEEAGNENLTLLVVRGSGFLARVNLFGSESLEHIADTVEHAQRAAWKERIEPGFGGILLGAAEADILCRRGQFRASLEVVERTFEEAQRMQWPPVELFLTHMRVLFLLGEWDEARSLAERYSAFEGGHRQQQLRAVHHIVRAVSALGDMSTLEASQEFGRAADVARDAGTLPALEVYSYALAFYMAVLAQDRAAEESCLRRVDQALERLPLFWMAAVTKLFRALRAARDGHPAEAAQLAEAAENAFIRVEDQAQLLLASRMRAAMALMLDEADAQSRMDDSAQRFEELGIPIPPAYSYDAIMGMKKRGCRPNTSCSGGAKVSMLATPIDRLAVHGFSGAQILDELFEVTEKFASRLEGPQTIWLDELGSEGHPLAIRRLGDVEPTSFLEFGDGCGRRFRLGMTGPLSNEERAAVSILIKVTSLSLEVAALRALTNPAGSDVSDQVPELPGFIAASESVRELVKEIARLGASRANVLIRGESGAGKEVVAHAVHKLSNRSGRPFVTFNCAAVPRELFEGQLFGYRKGAFTGATSNHPGVIRAADGGTLFLDEIGDLPLELQPKLLRFLENGEVFPLGETRPITVDVRIIAATHMNLKDMVRAGDFREDLYYRLAVVLLEIAPLRERREDVLALARHFIQTYLPDHEEKAPRLSPEAAARLVEHPWPGNVRELRNVIERSLAFSPMPEVLTVEHLRF